jgi:hypothetical protein
MTNNTALVFNNDKGACHMKSCSFLGLHVPSDEGFPRSFRILLSPSEWLLSLVKATACCADVAMETTASNSALYQIATTVASSEALRRLKVDHVNEVAITPPKSAL